MTRSLVCAAAVIGAMVLGIVPVAPTGLDAGAGITVTPFATGFVRADGLAGNGDGGGQAALLVWVRSGILVGEC